MQACKRPNKNNTSCCSLAINGLMISPSPYIFEVCNHDFCINLSMELQSPVDETTHQLVSSQLTVCWLDHPQKPQWSSKHETTNTTSLPTRNPQQKCRDKSSNHSGSPLFFLLSGLAFLAGPCLWPLWHTCPAEFKRQSSSPFSMAVFGAKIQGLGSGL